MDPAETTYFEAHGTGTPIGDPIEARAIASVFKETRTGDCPLRIGSVKTNIGHTETVSGLAAVIKVVLALENRQIPPSINFEKPNDKIRLDEWNLKVGSDLRLSIAGQELIVSRSLTNWSHGLMFRASGEPLSITSATEDRMLMLSSKITSPTF